MSNIVCTECTTSIPTEDVNICEGVALCRACGSITRLADIAQSLEEIPDADPDDTPAGCRVESDGIETTFHASLRSRGFAGFMLSFSVFWNGVSSIFVGKAIADTLLAFGIAVPSWLKPSTSQPTQTAWDLLFQWLFLAPFIVVGVCTACAAIAAIFGSCRVRLGSTDADYFLGVGPIGLRKRFDPSAISSIRLVDSGVTSNDQPVKCIEIESDNTVKLGAALTEKRLEWLAAALHRHVFGSR